MRVADRVVRLYEAEILTVVEKITRDVFTLKVAPVAPSGTVTLAGTVAAALLLESETRAPPLGAGPFSVTVPVEDPSGPPRTLVGLGLSDGGVLFISIAMASRTGPNALALVTARSSLPSPLKSPTATETGKPPAAKVNGARKVPSPLPDSTETLREPELATARSSLPSPLKSPTATEAGRLPPVLEIRAAWKV